MICFILNGNKPKMCFLEKKILTENSDNSSNMVSLDHHQLKNNLTISITNQTLKNF